MSLLNTDNIALELQQRIGLVVITHLLPTNNKMKMYRVKCDCGTSFDAYAKRLRHAVKTNFALCCDRCESESHVSRVNPFMRVFPFKQKIGRAKVLANAGVKNKNKCYTIQCDCGYVSHVSAATLMAHGHIKKGYKCPQCRTEESRYQRLQFMDTIGSKALSSWRYMVKQCYQRGRTQRMLSKPWHDFFAFFNDMKEPKEGQCLVQLRQYGTYKKEGCVWMDQKTFMANKHRLG